MHFLLNESLFRESTAGCYHLVELKAFRNGLLMGLPQMVQLWLSHLQEVECVLPTTPKATISTFGTNSQATLWISESAVPAKAVPGAGEFRVVKITVTISQCTITNSWTYGRPTISSLLLQNGVLKGNFVMLAYGANFGAEQVGFTAGAKTGGNSCEGTQWLFRTVLLCIIPPGLGGRIKINVTSLVIEGCATDAFSFNAPQGLILAGRTNAVSTGSVSLTLLCINFAARDASRMPRIDGTSASVLSYDQPMMFTVMSSNIEPPDYGNTLRHTATESTQLDLSFQCGAAVGLFFPGSMACAFGLPAFDGNGCGQPLYLLIGTSRKCAGGSREHRNCSQQTHALSRPIWCSTDLLHPADCGVVWVAAAACMPDVDVGS